MGKRSAGNKGKELESTLAVDPLVDQLLPNDEVVEHADRLLPVVEVVKVNPASLVELKTALDDTVKEFFSLPRYNFQVSHRHEDVRLSLGWTSVVIALGTTYYAYKKDDFQGTKSWVALGVVLYVVLNTILALYVTYFEKNIIWKGKRRTIASRITTELLEISSVASSSPTNSTQSSWIPFPLSLLASSPPPAPAAGKGDSTQQQYPLYTLTLGYTHSANANKSLLHQNDLVLHKHVGEVFDAQGRISRDGVEAWLREGLERVTSGNKEISK
ncbi:hypothetical protein JCM3766R1_002753 [Sporobolomyces carnicolor]